MSGLISNDLDAAHPCPSGAGSSIDLPLIPSSSASLNAEGAHIISRKPVSGNVASEASHPPSCDLKVSQDVDQLGRVSSDPQVNLVVGAASTPGPDYEDVSLRPQTYSPCNCTRVSFDPDCPDCNGFVAPTSLSYPVADQDIEMSIYSARKDDPQDGRDSDRNSIHSNIDDNEMANSVENSGAHINASPQSTGADVIPPSVPSQSGISSSAPLTMPLPASATSQLHNATLTTSFPVESIPSPPADIQALLHAHETGRPVSMIISRDAPLMPWILPDEVGYVWAGLFAVVRMKEDKLYAPSLRATSTTTLRVLWRFELEWICGGEESLKSEAQDSKEWQKTIQRPWWECTSSPSETALYSPMATDAPLTQNTVATEQDSDLINPTALDHSSPRQPFDAPIAHSLIPLPLLASFSASSSANDAFPSGYFCHNCGRVNVQRFLRHRACESAHCSVLRSRATMDQSVGGDSLESGVKEIRDDGQGWMMDVMAVRNPRLTYVCLFPDNMCLEPAVSLLRQDWGDGMRVFWYGLPSLSSLSQHMSLDGQVPPTPPIPVTPVSNLAPVTSEQVLHSDKHLVRHIFTGNLPRLQSEPTELFGRLQRDIQLERRYGETVFTKRFDSSAIIEGEGGTVVSKSITKLQEFMEYLVSTYGEEKAIKMPAIEILSWVGEGKARDVFRAKEKSLAVLCLGADVAFTFTYSDHNSKGTSAVPTKVPAKAPSVNLRNHDATSDTQDFGTKKKAKSPAVLRITLLHGDMMVLSGGDFEYFMARTGMCILAISSYVPGSRFISLPARV
ncbi:hypothetical protein HETIRDRAFT_386703 [Heterobasidion irregulare TC 32-1]|uniref:Uncharacterized protein n=1 Tax=Heterobasidion irregulare (strain TC 32-1) TaxID=747525 RepID=W4JY80_HETIT|nr:uncharacterized protein HETIRDRAFT_386703 [Heterobasidion irregulare TC 32-1]ETW78537.1 hypothetical protein HETIRDRAFT_386703 [Heterobasidion irregulare TC 32-1]